jgi:uncharacterized membrane protein YgdD (TMEM256/DUF423 family)
MNKNFLSGGALLAAIAVIGGAFGAHFLKTKLSVESLQTFETGIRYQFYHALALLAAGIVYKEFPGKPVKWAGNLFIGGIILFSGSLYTLCAAPSMKWLGPVTPLGGLCFISGWLLLAYAFIKRN